MYIHTHTNIYLGNFSFMESLLYLFCWFQNCKMAWKLRSPHYETVPWELPGKGHRGEGTSSKSPLRSGIEPRLSLSLAFFIYKTGSALSERNLSRDTCKMTHETMALQLCQCVNLCCARYEKLFLLRTIFNLSNVS